MVYPKRNSSRSQDGTRSGSRSDSPNASAPTTAPASERLEQSAIPRRRYTSSVRKERVKDTIPKRLPRPDAPDPSPQHLSSRPSETRNDPLWQDSFLIDGDKGLTQDAGLLSFRVSALGLPSLTDAVYAELTVADVAFRKQVTPSMFQYYVTAHYWARIASLHMHKGVDTESERHLVEFFSAERPLPEPLATYLRGIGDIMDSSGKYVEFEHSSTPESTVIDGLQGWFGRVGPRSHQSYEDYPSPGLAAFRILADFRRSLAPDPNAPDSIDWDLPPEIRPEPQARQDPGKPTKNLLGWARAIRLSRENVQNLEACGITPNSFPSFIHPYEINHGLMNFVSNHVYKAGNAFRCDHSGVHKSRMGSLAQTLMEEADYPREYQFDRTIAYAEYGVRARSTIQADARLATAARICSFRMRRESFQFRQQTISPWCCYDWQEYTQVPPNWKATSNVNFEYGAALLWNAVCFSTAYTSRDRLRYPWIRREVIQKSRT